MRGRGGGGGVKEVLFGTLSLGFTNFYDDYMLVKYMMIEQIGLPHCFMLISLPPSLLIEE